MKFQVVNVTPEMAKGWLKGNTLNRPIRKGYVSSLAEAMKRGEWMVNHQAIAMNGNRLLDGQHRLLALIESELPFLKMTVTHDAETSTFDTIDIGVKRSHADIFREDIHVMNPITTIARLVLGKNPTPHMVKPLYEKLHKSMREVVDAIPRQTRRWTASPIKVAALAAILNGESKEYVLGTYKAMALFDTKKMPIIAGAFVKQVMTGGKTAATGSRSLDLLVRAYTVFQKDNADQAWPGVRKVQKRAGEIREIYKKALGIK